MGISTGDAFNKLAEIVNQLPTEERTDLVAALGGYTHDLKHSLGVVTGANALISRLAADQPEIDEMSKIILEGSTQIDDLVNILVKGLNNEIRVE